MVRCTPAEEPADFDARVRKPGRRWLREHPRSGERPPAYWRDFTLHLAEAFEDRCAYTAMYLGTPGTVDHFVSIDEDRGLAYEWSNYRYAAGWINSRKQALKSSQILDPFEVREEWFELQLPSLHLHVSPQCPKKYRALAGETLRLLGLQRDARLIRYRRQWLAEYEKGEISLDYLERKAPLVAQAVRRWEQKEGRRWPSKQQEPAQPAPSGARQKRSPRRTTRGSPP